MNKVEFRNKLNYIKCKLVGQEQYGSAKDNDAGRSPNGQVKIPKVVSF